MKKKLSGGLAAATGLLLVAAGTAGGETFRIGDYDLWLTALQRQGEIILDGRISGGEECPRLELVADLENSKGNAMRVKTVIRDAGGFGSRLVDGTARCRFPHHPWTVTGVELRCRTR